MLCHTQYISHAAYRSLVSINRHCAKLTPHGKHVSHQALGFSAHLNLRIPKPLLKWKSRQQIDRKSSRASDQHYFFTRAYGMPSQHFATSSVTAYNNPASLLDTHWITHCRATRALKILVENQLDSIAMQMPPQMLAVYLDSHWSNRKYGKAILWW